jgi:hypothetical protein
MPYEEIAVLNTSVQRWKASFFAPVPRQGRASRDICNELSFVGESLISDSPGDMGGFRKVGPTTCNALALANMIGTGVFTSLGWCGRFPRHFWSCSFGPWGLVALCGALSYAELARCGQGGEYNFLRPSIRL